MKKLIIYSTCILFLMLVGLYVYGGRVKEKYPDYSTYSSKPQGLKALYLVAGQMGFDAVRYERPARFLPDGVTHVIIKPELKRFGNELEIKHLKSWVERGNTLILLHDAGNLSDLRLENFDLKHVEDLDAGRPVSVYTWGKGKLIYSDGAADFTNKGLKAIDPSVEFIRVLDYAGNKTVFFNEYYHNQGTTGITLWDILGQTGLLVLFQSLAAVAVFMHIKSRRLGKPVQVLEIVKRKENENLYALSRMYIKAKSYRLVLDCYLGYFTKQLSKYLGLGHTRNLSELILHLRGNKMLESMNTAYTLKKCEDYILNNGIKGKELLRLVTALENIRKEIK
ncbi:MAG: DUF4350 domain-containing protein [Clostridia bacterium]|nr:DUF4350 domain-containing protein [Clostridia bacterium]